MICPVFRFWRAGYLLLGCLATTSSVQAQIVPDNTLPVNSLVTPGCTVCLIDGGTIRDSNLFHSFSEFSVPTGGVAFFNNAEQIQNILTRVTGNSVSNIDGLLGANGTANLFLINPNGISFGANATLSLGGSFVASTASRLVFADGTVFSTKSDTSTPPLLTISVPFGLQYETISGSIQVQGAFLGVNVGQTLALVGGNVQLNGGALYTPGDPPSGRVELGGLVGEGTVGLVANGSYLGLSFPVGVVRGDISLSNGAVVDVVASGGGSLGINARNLTITQGSQLRAGIEPDGGAVDAVAGNIEINATGVIDLADESYMFNDVRLKAQGQGGDINITTSQLRVSSGSQISAATLGEGHGGNVTVNASQDVQVIGRSADGQYPSVLGASAQPGSSGNAGNLTINTGSLLVRDGAVVSAGTYGEGDGGNLTVNASQDVQLIGTSGDGQSISALSTSAEPGSSGKGGDLTINTGSLLVQDGAVIGAATFDEGDGGNLIVNASQQVQVIGRTADGRFPSVLSASAEPGSSGNAGDLTINTDTLLVRDGAQISAGTFSQGNGGNLTVNASQQVQIVGRSANDRVPSALSTSAEPGSSGKGGDLMINTDTLLVRDGAQVGAATFGEGDGGNLTVNASKNLQVIDTSADGQYASNLGTSANPGSSGKAGDLTINTDTLLVRDGAQVSAGTSGEGDGGNLTVNASNDVQVIGTSADGGVASGLFADAEPGASGNAGDLTINTDILLVRDGAEVTVSHPTGHAGNMSILAKSVRLSRGTLSAVTGTSSPEGGANITLKGLEFIRMDNESLISASALGNANGGNVTIDSTFIVATPPTGSEGSDIIANADRGNGGRVNVTTQGLFGIQFRSQRTPKNDITVSSTFGLSGEFALNTPGVDPSRGLAQLPTNVVDASQQIDQRCTLQAANQGSSFTVTGRGGIPPSPNDTLQTESLITPNWVILNSETENNTPPAPTTPTNSAPKQLVEAQGWRMNEQGQVVLTVAAPNVTPHDTWQTPVKCPAKANPGSD